MTAAPDGDGGPPRLRLDLNAGTLWSLPAWSQGPVGRPLHEQLAAVRAAGYEGFQSQGEPFEAIAAAGLRATAAGRALRPAEVLGLAARHQASGFEATSLHLGWGLDGDDDAARLAESVLETSAKLDYPLYVETHRATVTQDIWRTVTLVSRFPELRFNADLSHWYTGHELPYGDFDAKLDVMRPVLERVGMLHGRIGDAGAIQVSLAGREHEPFVDHFRRMWRLCFEGFLRRAGEGEAIAFAPELLPAELTAGGRTYRLDYARRRRDADGLWREDSDRWCEALQLCEIARGCFAEARGSAGDHVRAEPLARPPARQPSVATSNPPKEHPR